jgi:hypothetical protein
MWTVISALVVLSFAIFLYKIKSEVLEDEHHFAIGITIFFVMFVSVAVAISLFGPKPDGESDIAMLFRTALSFGVTSE